MIQRVQLAVGVAILLSLVVLCGLVAYAVHTYVSVEAGIRRNAWEAQQVRRQIESLEGQPMKLRLEADELERGILPEAVPEYVTKTKATVKFDREKAAEIEQRLPKLREREELLRTAVYPVP